MSKSELACVYASLILYDDNIEITPERITTICKAANIIVEQFWPTVLAKALKGRDISALLSNVGTATAALPVASGGSTTTTTSGGGDKAKVEEKKVEEKEEAKAESSAESGDDDMGFGLFGDDSD